MVKKPATKKLILSFWLCGCSYLLQAMVNTQDSGTISTSPITSAIAAPTATPTTTISTETAADEASQSTAGEGEPTMSSSPSASSTSNDKSSNDDGLMADEIIEAALVAFNVITAAKTQKDAKSADSADNKTNIRNSFSPGSRIP